jgi:phage recombination protein Bet
MSNDAINNTDLVAVDKREAVLAELTNPTRITLATMKLLQETICKGGTPEEIKLFGVTCGRTRLDPFTKQIHFVKRWDVSQQKEVAAHQIGIDGFRVIAQRHEKYRGRLGPWWCGKDGVWLELWTDEDKAPFAAKVGIVMDGWQEPVYATARWNAYKQTKKDGGLTRFWATQGPEQLAKCAEALGLRIACPNDLSNLYIPEELPLDERPVEPKKGRVQKQIEREAEQRSDASKSLASVLDESAGDDATDEAAVTDDAPAGMDESEGGDPRSAADRADTIAQGTVDDMTHTLAALRAKTGGKRMFFAAQEVKGKTRIALVDDELLRAAGSIREGAAVPAWLDNLRKSVNGWPALCAAVVKVADDLGVIL